MPRPLCLGCHLAAMLLPVIFFGCLPGAAWAAGDRVSAIVQTFAQSPVDRGTAVGVGVAVLINGQPPRLFSYGLANAATGQRFSPDSAFEIGSVTKVFTTNLLGQAIYKNLLGLDTPLSAFPVMLGSFLPSSLTPNVTLEQLADFTAGFPDYAPLCKDDPSQTGCLPSSRPDTTDYDAQRFLSFFQNTVPKNYQETPPIQVSSLPAPYNYSDFSVGLLGLILGGNPTIHLGNQALDGWVSLLETRLLRPLQMRGTYLFPPPRAPVSIALGYNQADGAAIITAGQVSNIVLDVPGSGYSASSPPRVSIEGGGGTGAQANAIVDSDGAVTGFTVTNGGQDYVAPPLVTFSPCADPCPVKANLIVSKQKATGIEIINAGSGFASPPDVTITGGHRNGIGRDAKGTAHIVNGQVSFVSINDSGDGYEPPVSVLVEPPGGISNTIPIWAPAGALHTTIRDMAAFATAALGQTKHGMRTIAPAIVAGFRIAETPYACSGKSPDLTGCPAGTLLSGLSWAIQPEDVPNNVPAIVLKNGGLPGFSTQLMLMPKHNLAVVVFVNSNGDQDSGEKPDPAKPQLTHEAETIARNILYALYYELVQPTGKPN